MRFKIVSIFIFVLMFHFCVQGKAKDYEDFLQRSEEQSFNLKTPVPTDDMIKKILEMKTKVESYRETDISKVIEKADFTKADKNKQQFNLGSKSIWLFVSSSMPDATIRNYVADIARYNLPINVVIRGLVQADMRTSVTWIHSHLKKKRCSDIKKCKWHKVSFNINPMPFRYFHINRVPALAMGDKMLVAEALKETSKQKMVVYGDASIEALLEKLSEKEPEAKALLGQFGGFYNE